MDYIAEKLTHASAEVRGRALESLEFKWKYGLVQADDLLQDPRVLRGLLGLLGMGDGPQATAVALLLMRRMVAVDSRLARALLELGALPQLHATPIPATHAPGASSSSAPYIWIQPGVWPDEVLPSVEALAKLLMGFMDHPIAPQLPPPQPPPQPQPVGAALGSDAAGSPPLMHTHLSSSSLSSAAAGAGDGESPTAAGTSSTPHAAAGTAPASSSHGVQQGTRGANSGAASSSRLGNAAAVAAGPEVEGGEGSGEGPDGGVAEDSGDTSLFDERMIRARARADWRETDPMGAGADAGVPLYPGDSSNQGPPAGHLTLPMVSLSAADDQALFELNVRVQYSDDERLLLPALLELSGALGVDLPAEALLLRPSVLDNCLALVGSSTASKAVQQAAATVLLRLVQGLQQSSTTYKDPELSASEYSDAAAAAAAAAAAGNAASTDLFSCLRVSAAAGSSAGPSGGFREAAKALAAAQAPLLDPSCPNSYPQLMLPDIGPDAVWRLPAGALEGTRVDVTAAVASICLQTAELLKHPDRHYQLLPLLEEALPLLAAPLCHLAPSNKAPPTAKQHQQLLDVDGMRSTLSPEQQQRLRQHMHAMWRGLLAALSRALAACAAVGAADRAAAATAGLARGGQPGNGDAAAVAAVTAAVPAAASGGVAALAAGGRGDGGLCVWDLPTLNLLMLGLRWINAAPPSWLTPSMVPSNFTNTVEAAACDESVALVVPQLRAAAKQLLQQLKPGALQALAAAHAVPTAWQAGEEALKQLPAVQQRLQALQPLQQQQRPQQGSQEVQKAQGDVSAWLNKIEEGLAGLGYAPRWDAKLLAGTLHGLSLVAASAAAACSSNQGGASDGVGSGSWEAAAVQRVSGVMLTLLRHHSPSVRQLMWQLLQSAVESLAAGRDLAPGGSSSPGDAEQSPVVRLLLLPEVLECLVVEQLNSADAKPAVCRLLLCMLRCQGSSVAQRLLTWRAWISSCAGDAAGDGLIAALGLFLDNPADKAGLDQGWSESDLTEDHGQEGFWSGGVAAMLQDLFSTKSELRRDAGRQLLQVLVPGVPLGPNEVCDLTDDPFRGFLISNQQSTNSSQGTAASLSSSRFLLPPDPLTDASANLAATFSRQDVINLLAVLANRGLAQELRRSAAEELLALTPDRDLLGVMVQRRHLEHIWQLCVPPEDLSDYESDDNTGHDGDDAAAVKDTGIGQSQLPVGAGDPSGSIFDMQLPIAGMQLLAGLMARSNDALEWFARDPDRLLQPLMPQVLHTLNSVRKAVARVLALALFGHAAQLWSSFAQMAAAAANPSVDQTQGKQRCMPLLPPGAQGVLLPLPFRQGFKFPFKVCWLPLETHAASGIAAAAAVSDAKHQGMPLLEQHRVLVKQLVEQQQILRAAAAAAAADGSTGETGNAAAVAAAGRHLLADCPPVELSHVSQRVLATTAANLTLVDPSAVAARCLAATAGARSHAECAQALASIEQQLGGTQWGLMAVLQSPGPGWLSAVSRLIGTAPITREDQQLWHTVLQLVERLLLVSSTAPRGSSTCTAASLVQLQLLMQQSVSVWLQQPAAAAAAPRPPLALAAGTASWDALRAQPSSAASAAAVADALGLSGGSGAAAAVAGGSSSGSSDASLTVTVSRQALRTLLMLIQTTRRHCAAAVGFYQQQDAVREADTGAASSNSRSALLACYSLSALNPCVLMRQLADCVIGVAEGADYGCRVLASAVLCQVLGALQDTAACQPSSATGAGSSSTTDAAAAAAAPPAAAVQTEGASEAVGFDRTHQSGAAGVSAAVLHLMEVWVCRVLMPVAGRQLPGFTGKALVRLALSGLVAVVEGPLVCGEQWTQAWADMGGTFWLSRLCRDREASIRLLALRLTSALLQPGRTATQTLIIKNWPDCVHRLLRVSGDVCEAHGVRAAALKGLAAAMVLPLDALQPQQQVQETPVLPAPPKRGRDDGSVLTSASGGGADATDCDAATAEGAHGAGRETGIETAPARVKKMHGFGLAPLLQADAVWQQLLPQLLLKWQQQPPGLTAAAAVLAAVAAAAEPDGVGRQLLLVPGVAAAAVGIAAAGDSSDTASEPGSDVDSSCMAPANHTGSKGGKLVPWSRGDEAAAVVRQHCDRLGAAAAALQLLSLAAAPSSTGGGMLPLPASVQAELQAGPAVAARLMCSVGRSLQAQQQAVQAAASATPSEGSSSWGEEAGVLLSLQRQQLTVFRVAAAALMATAATWPEGTRQQQLLSLLQAQPQAPAVPGGSKDGVGCGQLLRAMATCLAHPVCSRELRLACTQLIGVLLSDAELAAAALGSSNAATAGSEGGTDADADAGNDLDQGADRGAYEQAIISEAVFGGSGGEPIGAVLCRELASQLPGSIFLPTTPTEPPSSAAAAPTAGVAAAVGAGSGVGAVVGSTAAWGAAAGAECPVQLMVASPEGLVVVFALQNLLAFSRAAKAAALGIGLHKLLLESALSMAAAVTAAASTAGATSGGNSAAAGRRTRARWFSTPAGEAGVGPAAAAAAAPTVGGASRKGNASAVAFGRSGGPELPSFTAVAGVRRPAGGAGSSGAAATPPGSKGKAAAGSSTNARRGGLSLRGASAVKAKQQKEQQQADQADAEPVQLPEQQQQEAAEGSTLTDGEEPAVAVQPQGQAAAVMQEEQEQQLGAPTLAGSEASQHVSLLQQQLRQQQEISPQLEATSVGAVAADGAAAVIPAVAAGTSSGAGAGGGSSGLSKQQLLAAAKQLNMRKLLVSVVLLRHLAYGCEDTQEALTADGLVDFILKLWPLALQHTPLLLELTRLLSNTLPHCYEARLAAAALPGPACSPVWGGTVLSCLLSLLVGQQLNPQLQQGAAGAAGTSAASGSSSSAFAAAAGTAAAVKAAAGVLLGYASTEDGAVTLVKAGASCLSELAKAVRGCIVSARREAEPPQQRQLNADRLGCVLQLLAVLAGHPAGQKAMMRATVAPVMLELSAEVLQLPQQPAAAPAALLLVRNLAFNGEVRSPLLANGALLPLLLSAAESLLVVLPAAERQQWLQRLTAADQDLSAAAVAEAGCDCRPPKWDPVYQNPWGVGSGGGAGAGSGSGGLAGGKLAVSIAGGSSSRPGSPMVLGTGGVGVPSAAGNVCCAAYGVSALWALVHNGEKVKAALRKLPAAAARLGVVKAHADQLLQQQEQVQSGEQRQIVAAAATGADGRNGAGGTGIDASGGGVSQFKRMQGGSRLGLWQQQVPMVEAAGTRQLGPAGDGGVWVGPASVCDGAGGLVWWLRQLQDSCGALLELMDGC